MSADGRAVDAEVAEKVMGLKVQAEGNYEVGPVIVGSGKGWGPSEDTCPFYSSSIEDAFQVVEKMSEKGYMFSLISQYVPTEDPKKLVWGFGCKFFLGDHDIMEEGAKASSAPLAICQAALRSLAPGAGKEKDR